MKRATAPDLYSERLILRDMTEDDAAFIVQIRSNPEVYRFFTSPHKISEEEHLNWYHYRYIYDNNRFDWIAFLPSGERVGVFGVKRESENATEAEISYILLPEKYGKGYASEAIKRLIIFCQCQWKCDSIVAEIHKDNFPSVRFIERLGFKKFKEHDNFVDFSLNL